MLCSDTLNLMVSLDTFHMGDMLSAFDENIVPFAVLNDNANVTK